LKDASSTNKPQYRHPKLGEFAAELAQAARARDVGRVRTMLRDSVTIGGLWFDDVQCMVKFGAPGEVRGPALDELARCLTTIDLAVSSREDALPDVVLMTYGSGLELEARLVETWDGPWLAWIGYVARRSFQDALPTISGTSLEALRVEGDRHAPMSGPGTFEELATMKFAFAWLKVCIDGNGAVTGAHVREASSPRAARAFAAATQSWKFRPFLLRGQPAPVCAVVQMRHPVDPAPKREVLPLPLPEEMTTLTNLPAMALGDRISGKRLISPDDSEKTLIQKARISRVLGALHYCIDTTGRVDRVTLVRSTGLRGYDRRLVEGVRAWVFKPYLDEGQPVAVCSSVHFIYSQGSSGQPGQFRFGSARTR
jgi:TonB family protein